ncbi:hypothetical protein BJF79_21865 [Actinomadura sp. CNU-125]|uniref:hypothetical protein n=1 Tax=Actinomadura sp. CNU-125 TaxID=1904961 RepID=UPI000959EC29|nr:hypothetical protein [Actinomadura sp. CNU-125]OLT12581.1 hypothetical protein BJF79_21865 [Actinomadura sp. CNU-125]
MAHRFPRLLPIVLTAALTAAAASACGGDEPAPASGGDGGNVAVAGIGYTSDQLSQALLTELAGYRRAGDPDLGEYGTLRAIRNAAHLQESVVLDKPRCANAAGGPGGKIPAEVPAALVSFAKEGGWTVTQTLMAMSADEADEQVDARVPSGCLEFKTKIGSKWAGHRVTESPRGEIGQGSRTVGVTTIAGTAHTKAWYVVFRGRDYLATISVVGPNATRDEAERIARAALGNAERFLP